MRKAKNRDFLELLAERLLHDYGEALSSVLLVFPSRRAALFFQHSLASLISKPIVAPNILTIRELSCKLSGCTASDNLTLTALLYDEMKSYYHEEGIPFEDYSIEIRIEQCLKMVTDFNDLDNYLIPVEDIFKNIHNLEELSSLDYLSKEQKETICSFWNLILPSKEDKRQLKTSDSIKERFVSFAGVIRKLYPRFKARLLREGRGYEGMLVKEAGSLSEEELKSRIKQQFPFVKTFVFAGLYAITPAEKRLLKLLQRVLPVASLSFFWEGFPSTDSKTLWNQEIIKPFRDNIQQNYRDLGGHILLPTSSEELPLIEILESSTQVAGRKMLPSLVQSVLTEDPQAVEELRMAVVLPEERELPSLLSALTLLGLPLNVTMGYPLSSSNVAIWFTQCIEFLMSQREQEETIMLSAELLDKLIRHPLSTFLLTQEEFDVLNKVKVYSLPYFSLDELSQELRGYTSTFCDKLLSPPKSAIEMLDMLLLFVETLASSIRHEIELQDQSSQNGAFAVDLEFLKKYQETLTSLRNVFPIMADDMPVSTVAQLLNSLIAGVNVPFEGEPLEGLQVMGLLESRLLLFDYLLIPDANEHQLPRPYSEENSFIPFNLRVGYGLPVYQFKESIEAYYFYRLLVGAKKVFFITGGADDVEPSRYILQLQHLSNASIQWSSLRLPEAALNPRTIVIEKTPEVMQLLERFFDPQGKKIFSPSSLNVYSACPLRFYFQHVLDIKEDLTEDDLLTPIDLGNVIHTTMEILYQDYRNEAVCKADFEKLLSKASEVVLQQYRKTVFRGRKDQAILEGIHQIYSEIAIKYVKTILEHDSQYGSIHYLESEHSIRFSFPLKDGREVSIKGIIDRIDVIERDGEKILRIVDYKTGADELVFKKWSEILPHGDDDARLNKAVTQLMLYCSYISSSTKYKCYEHIEPSLYILRQMIQDPNGYDASLYQSQEKNDKQPIMDYRGSTWQKNFEDRLSSLLEEIFDEHIPFRQTTDKFSNCHFCQFATFCGV